MEKKCVNEIRCYNPYSFYTFWVMILVWITLSIFLGFGFSHLQSILDLFGFIGFVGIFIVIAKSFSTVSGKKEFLCNAYDGIAKYFNKLLVYEALIISLSVFLAIGFNMHFFKP